MGLTGSSTHFITFIRCLPCILANEEVKVAVTAELHINTQLKPFGPSPRSFDVEEFQGGARDAFLAVMEKFAARDIAGLEELTSKPVRDAFEGTWQQYEAKGLTMKLHVTSVSSATVVGGGFLSDEQLMEVDEALPEVDHTVHGFKFTSTAFRRLFLNVKVHFQSVEVCEMRNRETGALQSVMEDRRGHTWHFARRVPPAMPAEELQDSWRLVHIE